MMQAEEKQDKVFYNLGRGYVLHSLYVNLAFCVADVILYKKKIEDRITAGNELTLTIFTTTDI